MSFINLDSTPSAAVAPGGTLTFTLPNAALWGAAKLEGGHTMFAEGLQAGFNFPNDFTLSASGAVVTLTYNGVTPLPAGKLVKLQLETPGENNYLGDGGGVNLNESGKDYLGNYRWVTAKPVRIVFGAVAAASTTAVLATAARAGTVKNVYANPVVLDVPRNLQYVSSTTDTTQTVTAFGTDEYGVAISESVTLNGTTPVLGKKAFKTVTADQNSIALAGNLSIGTGTKLGLPLFLPGGTAAGAGYILKEIQDGAVATAGTFVGGDLTKATGATGDVRGTWTPNAAPNGTIDFEVVAQFTDKSFKGVSQFTA